MPSNKSWAWRQQTVQRMVSRCERETQKIRKQFEKEVKDTIWKSHQRPLPKWGFLSKLNEDCKRASAFESMPSYDLAAQELEEDFSTQMFFQKAETSDKILKFMHLGRSSAIFDLLIFDFDIALHLIRNHKRIERIESECLKYV